MMFKSYKSQSLILYIGSLLCIVLLARAFWNIYLKLSDSNIFWPLIFFILSIFLVSALYTTYLKATNGKILENIIDQKIEEERSKILSEFSKQETKEQETDNVTEINEKIKQILPKGSFKNLDSYAKKLLNNMSDELVLTQGIIYMANSENNTFSFLTGYALTNTEPIADFQIGENLNGQVAASQEIMIVKDIPDDYLSVESGLGKSKPRNLIIAPFIYDKKTIAIIEFTTFQEITNSVSKILSQLTSEASEKMLQLKMS
jgi:putative methionine-R-sulfoxide reductase with GAF domain